MAFPFAAVASGFGVLNSLLQGQSLSRQAAEQQRAIDAAIKDYQRGGDEAFSSALSGGTYNLASLEGILGSSLRNMGSNLGASLAGAGVTNSSAAAGALARGAGQNASTYKSGWRGLLDTLAQRRAGTLEGSAQMRLGNAQNQQNYIRQMQAGNQGGISSILGSLGQMDLAMSGTRAHQPNNTGPAVNGTSGGQLPGVWSGVPYTVPSDVPFQPRYGYTPPLVTPQGRYYGTFGGAY